MTIRLSEVNYCQLNLRIMDTIRIDFSEEVSVDTILMPIFDKSQKCVGGLLFKEKEPERKKYISVEEMIRLVGDYKRLLPFARKALYRMHCGGSVYAFEISLGDTVIAYDMYLDKGMLGLDYLNTISAADYALEYED